MASQKGDFFWRNLRPITFTVAGQISVEHTLENAHCTVQSQEKQRSRLAPAQCQERQGSSKAFNPRTYPRVGRPVDLCLAHSGTIKLRDQTNAMKHAKEAG